MRGHPRRMKMIYTTGGLGYGQEAVWAKVKGLLKALNTNDVIE